MNHFSTGIAYPTRSHLSDQVGAAHNANQPTLIKHQQTLDTLIHEDTTRLFQVSIRSYTNDPTGHDVHNRLTFFANDIVLGNNPYNYVISVNATPPTTA